MKQTDRSLYASRPKWASRLTFEQWENLKDCQNRAVPSLARLKRDREYQRRELQNNPRRGVLCWTCLECARAAGIEDQDGRPLYTAAMPKDASEEANAQKTPEN